MNAKRKEIFYCPHCWGANPDVWVCLRCGLPMAVSVGPSPGAGAPGDSAA